MGKIENLPLFVTKLAKGRILFHLYALLLFLGICLIFVYRIRHIPRKEEDGRWAWIGLFLSELWFCVYWFVTTVVRWNPIYRYTFKDRLSHRSLYIFHMFNMYYTYMNCVLYLLSVTDYINRYENALPGVDIFVCTADPMIEPPVMVINTVLSVMAYDYPPEKLSVYLSDDGGSDLTFYAMLEASRFSKIWLPFCKKFKVEPRCPEAYFHTAVEPQEPVMSKEWSTVKVHLANKNHLMLDHICVSYHQNASE